MKVICLIRQKPPAHYFVNTIHKKHPVSLAIIERPGAAVADPEASLWSRVRRRMQQKNLGALVRAAVTRLIEPFLYILKAGRRDQLNAMYNRAFGDSWQKLNEEIPVLWVQNINDEAVRKRLEEEKPDVLLDHGTSIVKPHILSAAPITLNLHWGLSPYYRGTNCTNWALVRRDPLNIGVTIHKLSQEVDGGDIVGQARVLPESNDTVRSINTKLTRAGTDVMIRALDMLAQGKQLPFHKQNLSQGLLTRGRDYTEEIAQKVRGIEKEGLKEILEHPFAKKLAIFEIL